MNLTTCSRKLFFPIAIFTSCAIIFTSCGGGEKNKEEIEAAKKPVVASFSRLLAEYERKIDALPNFYKTIKGDGTINGLDDATFQQSVTGFKSILASSPSAFVEADVEKVTKVNSDASDLASRIIASLESKPHLNESQSVRDLLGMHETVTNACAIAANEYNNAVATYNALEPKEKAISVKAQDSPPK